eukprot:COSAG04_NODE_2449_length_4101_cov_30.628333_5_plen_63_part_01
MIEISVESSLMHATFWIMQESAVEGALDDDAPKPLLVAMLQASDYAAQFAKAAEAERKRRVEE